MDIKNRAGMNTEWIFLRAHMIMKLVIFHVYITLSKYKITQLYLILLHSVISMFMQ